MQPTPIFLPGKFCGQRSLVGCSPQGYKESDMTERLTFTFFFFPVYFQKCVDFPVFLPLLKPKFILLQVREDTLY